MLTTFLLHGGMLSQQDERNDAYFRKLTEGLKDGDQVLFIGFARRDEQERNEIYERDKGFILAQAQADISCINATHDKIIEQLKQSKAVHITGGETPELIQDVLNYPDFIEGIKGKRIGGSSAGACLLSAYYFINDERGVLKGMGVLPIRLRVHGDNPKFGNIEKSVELLKTYPGNLELVLLKECDWIQKERWVTPVPITERTASL